jgi:multidrug resistance protein
MKFDKSNKTLFFLVLLMLVNALAYGTIIPLLYPFAKQFGLSETGLGLLFASFSLFQFIATPIMGRLSDQYGRRPLLLFSIFGTGVSLIMFGLAQTVWQLFLARIIDGITGGNISVAQAVIADTTSGKERAKAFGMIGASFGFGFLLGPAIGGFLSTYGLSVPFIFSGILAFAATIFGYFFLEESLPDRVKAQESKEPLFNIGEMVRTLKRPVVGTFIWLSLIASLGFNAFILGSQSFTNDVLHLSTLQIGIYFSVTGLFSIFMQAFGIKIILEKFKSKPLVMTASLLLAAVSCGLVFLATGYISFTLLSFLFFISNSPIMPLLSGLLSEAVHQDEQGVILGINQSYVSVGQIFGPLMAGAVAKYSHSAVFILAGGIFALGFWIINAHKTQIARIEPKQ